MRRMINLLLIACCVMAVSCNSKKEKENVVDFRNKLIANAEVTGSLSSGPVRTTTPTTGTPVTVEGPDTTVVDPATSTPSPAVSSPSTGSSSDWDAVLTSYEEFVDQYIAMLQKASHGDPTALAQYPGLLQKAQDCGDKLNNAKGEMTPAQWQRYTQILQKMTNAAASMR